MSLKIRVGDQIPSIGLRASDGYLLNLRSFVTKQPVVFLFFGVPTLAAAARRRGTKAIEALVAGHERVREAGIAIIGVSCDSAQQQTEYIAEAKLPFLLFSDERRSAVDILGVPTIADGENVNVARPVAIGISLDGEVRTILRDIEPAALVDQLMAAFAEPMPVV